MRAAASPVRHQPLIGAMEAAKLGLVVGKGLLASEKLSVAREAGVHGIAAAMDDASVRQDEPDHADKREIGRHLVDHVRRPAAIGAT